MPGKAKGTMRGRAATWLPGATICLPNVIKVGVTGPAHLGSSPPTQWLPCSAQLESSAGLHLAGAGAGARLGFAAEARTADNTS